jgi:predicted RNase H-like HicB family nuclease
MSKKIDVSMHLDAARAIVARYQKRIEPSGDGIFVGFSRDFPGVVVDADTEADCLRLLIGALNDTVALTLHRGQQPPTPLIDANMATEQVNVRVSAREKLLLAEEAQSRRTSQSDVIRAALRTYLHLVD